MWFIVNTDKFQEQKTKEFLEETYPGIIRQVYLPKCRTKYQNTNGGERFRLKPQSITLSGTKTRNSCSYRSFGFFDQII